ncbi:MAG: C45 family peptidase [Actinomycetota bacterium]|nr:C45 family peptidase [Actinomycetota bacterium]
MSSVRSFVSTVADPRERGAEFGAAHSREVGRVVERYRALFARRSPAGFDVRRWARRFEELIGDWEPSALAEIHAIAEGAGVDPLDVVALNARTEILAKADPYGETECSAVLVQPEEGDAFGVQTWDWYAEMADGWLLWRMPLADGGWLETVTEYGVLAKIGINDRGLAVLLNILHHRNDDGDDVGLPVHLLARRILEKAATPKDAEQICRRTQVAASTSLTVLDEYDGVGIELFPAGPGLLHPRDGLLVRTNHFLSPEGEPGCLTKKGYPSTHIRLDWLDAQLRAHPPRTPADVLPAMNHHDEQGGVCRHPGQGGTPEAQPKTLATVTVRPRERAMDVLAGGPSGH